MGSQKLMIVLVALLTCVTMVSSTTEIECSSMTALVSTCYAFITYMVHRTLLDPGSQCCNAMESLELLSDPTVENRRFACRCLMSLISTYNPNAYALATLPDFCQISLGFSIDPNTDCNLAGCCNAMESLKVVYMTMIDAGSHELENGRPAKTKPGHAINNKGRFTVLI